MVEVRLIILIVFGHGVDDFSPYNSKYDM